DFHPNPFSLGSIPGRNQAVIKAQHPAYLIHRCRFVTATGERPVEPFREIAPRLGQRTQTIEADDDDFGIVVILAGVDPAADVADLGNTPPVQGRTATARAGQPVP
ncbi:MAG: hypothetical protein PHD67_11225, partial [Oscillospiraceae bacterium]|nr:hypothetical protein [Oscillospiraceae bacterium]